MIRDVMNQVLAAMQQDRPCVLCTLVETRGSTPQKAGAAMLVFTDGSQVGTLGGGCVEAEVKQRALRSLSSPAPQVFTFHLDDNYGWDDGLICGGRMSVLAQPLVSASDETSWTSLGSYFTALARIMAHGSGGVEAVLLAECETAAPGARFLFDGWGNPVATLHAGSVPQNVEQGLPTPADRPRPSASRGVAYLPILPRIRLLIVGGGHVGQAVSQLAAQADFDVWVVDDREMYANQERFPQAQQTIVGPIGPTLQRLREEAIDSFTFCIIVTRGHAHDEEALFHLAESSASYVGMIGSKRKIRLIYDDLLAKGIRADALQRVHAPLGLDIGSQTVPEIAVSIVAELIAVRNLGSVPPGMRSSVPVHGTQQ